ncbi:MAG: caspase family protein, partial [Pseudomonadota bacterium]
FETVDVNFILRQMERSSETRIAILDACRDNPMAAVLAKNASGPPVRSGLAEIAVDTAGAGTVIAFATSPGKAAYDGEGAHSPFTSALLDHIDAPDVNIQTMFTRVTGDVYRNTAKQQRPWVNASLVTEVFLNKTSPIVQAPATPSSDTQVALSTSRSTAEDKEELQAFEKAIVAGDAASLRAFLDRFPQSPRASEARTMIAGLTEGDTTAAADPAKKGNLLILPGEDSPIKFALPLTTGPYPVNGKSLQALAQGQPLFSPIEGLPPSVWKDKNCSTCHQWDRVTLCDQGSVYARSEPEHMLRKQHPYGGPFKLALRNWSKTGCQ